MIRILLNGCNGKMGQVITKLAMQDEYLKVSAGVDIITDRFINNYPVYSYLYEVKEEADVIIDFSNVKGLNNLLSFGMERNIPMVICTTGLSPDDREMIEKASKHVAILRSSNMSYGFNLILNLVKSAARALDDSFDIEIIEKHHNQKVDAPSGSAMLIADSINSIVKEPKKYIYERHSNMNKRTNKEIGIHSIRGGSIVGDHSVIFAGAGEILEINHSAISRDVFGIGTLKAAKFLYNKEHGLYNMDNVINQ